MLILARVWGLSPERSEGIYNAYYKYIKAQENIFKLWTFNLRKKLFEERKQFCMETYNYNKEWIKYKVYSKKPF